MVTIYRKADLPMMFAEFGVPVTLGAATTDGIVDRVGDETAAGFASHSVGTRIQVSVVEGTLPGIVAGALVTVDGVEYSVAQVLETDDGGVIQFLCGERGA